MSLRNNGKQKEGITIETKRLNGNCAEDIVIAAELLKNGGLVAIPTETVYGLAADATNGAAVERIFKAKGRPQDNPLIVHISSYEQLERLVSHIPEHAKRLMETFWPGPLTVILPKSNLIPDQVSAGLPRRRSASVSSRGACSHSRGGVPGSAFCKFQAVLVRLPQRMYHDLDGKSTRSLTASMYDRVESTVITGGSSVLLRPGAVTLEQLQQVLGTVKMADAVLHQLKQGSVAASPGMKYKHYAPKAKLILLEGSDEAFFHYVNAHAAEGVAALCYDGQENCLCVPAITYGKRLSSGAGTAIIPCVA
ncbi:MAG: L-threonylcarbamoyladenylate synthase [Acutalibacteraceae bacterium]